MEAISPWGAAVQDIFEEDDLPSIYQIEICKYTVKVHCIYNALWIAINCPKGTRVILRPAFSLTNDLKLTKISKHDDGVTINLNAVIGTFRVRLQFPDKDMPLVRCTTTLNASQPLFIPFWPRDMVICGTEGKRHPPKGKVHFTQWGARSGLQFINLDEPQSGTLLYMQNLTALNDYCEAIETAPANVIGGTWPELGFALPPTKEKPLPLGIDIIISDAFLAFSPQHTNDELKLAKLFFDLLAAIYLHLPRPATKYHNWPAILDKGLNDLETSHACWSHGNEHDYLNAYVSDYNTPPELMVQLAVLLPLLDYQRWSKKDIVAIDHIKNGLAAFYSKELGTVVRWLPALAKDLDGSEEQLKPNVMDSWYLHHPLLNLGRMAGQGDENARQLFMDSIPFAMKVARHFKYNWPVFYNMETLEVIKAETVPGKGGEKDVAGLYAHVMLYAWELTNDEKYLNEAKKAAKSLRGKGFDLFYQANNTAFSANAMLWLHQVTGKELYLDLCCLCLANIFKNMQLWECNYGFAKHYSTFFGIFPLNDAPYTAAYEEQEVFAAVHNLLVHAESEKLLPSVSMLLAEFVRYIVHRAAFYYPPNLPKEMLSDKVKMGQVDTKLWIAIEDIHDGWEQSGEVGQEVYGAGVAFGIVPRHYFTINNEPFRFYIDYPTDQFAHKKGAISFNVKGDERLSCRMMIIPTGDKKLPEFIVTGSRASEKKTIEGKLLSDGHMEFAVYGNQHVHVKW